MLDIVKDDLLQLGMKDHQEAICSTIGKVLRFFDKIKEEERKGEETVKYDVKWLTARLEWVETNLSLHLDEEVYLFFEKERQLIKRQLLLYRKTIQPTKQQPKEKTNFTVTTG